MKAQHFNTELHLGRRMTAEFVSVTNYTDIEGDAKPSVKVIWKDCVSDEDGRTFINADLKLSASQAHELVDILIFALDKLEALTKDTVETFTRAEFNTPKPTINDIIRSIEESEGVEA